ncbi:MAG TPA: GNAT family N-acetyltransferase [Methylomirabilota bacterium]|nr:GNAT family N-acetyltransferase [Methylomirabilota bacterium]
MTEIVLSRCTLRPWRAGDEASLERYANNRNISRNLRDRFPYPYSAADAKAWIAFNAGLTPPPQHFAIVVDGTAAGGISVEPGEGERRRTAEVGYWLGEPFWGRGIATEALRAITEYGFATFDVCRLEAGVFGWNPASARVLEKAGYTLEGRLRQAIIKDGKMTDRLLYGLVRS